MTGPLLAARPDQDLNSGAVLPELGRLGAALHRGARRHAW